MLVAAKSVAGDATATLPLGAYRPRVLVEQHLPGGGSLPFRAHAETLLRATGVGTDRPKGGGAEELEVKLVVRGRAQAATYQDGKQRFTGGDATAELTCTARRAGTEQTRYSKSFDEHQPARSMVIITNGDDSQRRANPHAVQAILDRFDDEMAVAIGRLGGFELLAGALDEPTRYALLAREDLDRAVVRALADVGGEKAVPALLRHWQRQLPNGTANPTLRRIEGLAPRFRSSPEGAAVQAKLIALAGDRREKKSARLGAVRGLGALGGKTAAEALLSVRGLDGEGERFELAEAIGRAGETLAARQRFEQLVASASPTLKSALPSRLAELCLAPNAAPEQCPLAALIRLAFDPSAQLNAGYALGAVQKRHGDLATLAAKTLTFQEISGLAALNGGRNRLIAEALVKTGDARALPLLLAYLERLDHPGFLSAEAASLAFTRIEPGWRTRPELGELARRLSARVATTKDARQLAALSVALSTLEGPSARAGLLEIVTSLATKPARLSDSTAVTALRMALGSLQEAGDWRALSPVCRLWNVAAASAGVLRDYAQAAAQHPVQQQSDCVAAAAEIASAAPAE
jgi:hypothetical protein